MYSYIMLNMHFVTLIIGTNLLHYSNPVWAWAQNMTYPVVKNRSTRLSPKPPPPVPPIAILHSNIQQIATLFTDPLPQPPMNISMSHEPQCFHSSLSSSQETKLLQQSINYIPSLLIRDEAQTFPVVVDSGATASVSYCKEDFITPLSPSPFRQMKGLAETLDVEGRGILWWIVNDDSGHELTIETEAYYVPAMSMRLLSPQAYFRGIRQGHAIVRPDHIQLCWDKENQVLTIPCDPINNLPIVQAGRKEEKKKML